VESENKLYTNIYNIYIIMNLMKYVYNTKINKKKIINDPTKFVSDCN